MQCKYPSSNNTIKIIRFSHFVYTTIANRQRRKIHGVRRTSSKICRMESEWRYWFEGVQLVLPFTIMIMLITYYIMCTQVVKLHWTRNKRDFVFVFSSSSSLWHFACKFLCVWRSSWSIVYELKLILRCSAFTLQAHRLDWCGAAHLPKAPLHLLNEHLYFWNYQHRWSVPSSLQPN